MGRAKDIRVKPISAQSARRIIRQLHYSRKVCSNSQLHFGVFLDGRCGGALQFGPSMDKRKVQGLVSGTRFNGFLELNRMALADWLPPNGESRAIGVCLRMIRKRYPHVEWIVSYSDATQCGDGAIYRASGFVLTSIKENKTILRMPDGSTIADITLNVGTEKWKEGNAAYWRKHGARSLPGYQLRYIYFLNPAARERLAVPVIPFRKIDEVGAAMYRGKSKGARSIEPMHPPSQVEEGGAIPTRALHATEGNKSEGD